MTLPILIAIAAQALDLNDVSVLMPVADRPELLEVLPHLNQDNVYDWTETQRNTMLSRLSSHIEPIRDPIKDFVLTSIRLDPCSNRLALEKTDWRARCEAEFRLVWQKLEGGRLADSNIHTIYSLNRSDLENIVARLGQLHSNAGVDTRGMALAPHPVIAAEGKDSPYLKGILEIVETYARKENLRELAHMVANTERNWTLGHIAVDQGEAKFMPIPTMGKDEIDIVNVNETINTPEGSSLTVHTYGKIGNLKEKGLLADRPYSPDLNRELDFFPILNRVVEAFAVENPEVFTPKTINCSTCHVSEKLKAGHSYIAEVTNGQVWNGKFQKPVYAYPRNSRGLATRTAEQGKFLPLAGYAPYGYQNSKWNMDAPFARPRQRSIQMFSFNSDEEPVIATRVVNDSAITLDVIEILLSSKSDAGE